MPPFLFILFSDKHTRNQSVAKLLKYRKTLRPNHYEVHEYPRRQNVPRPPHQTASLHYPQEAALPCPLLHTISALNFHENVSAALLRIQDVPLL